MSKNLFEAIDNLDNFTIDERTTLKEIEDGACTFTLKMDVSNDDFASDNMIPAVARILQDIARTLEYTDKKSVLDANGNVIGAYGFGYEDVMDNVLSEGNIDTAKEQWNKVTEIFGDKVSGETPAGQLYYIDATIDEIERVLKEAPEFMNLKDYANEAPTTEHFVNFLKSNPQFVAECYVVNPNDRSDYRVEIVGIKAPDSDENRATLEQFIKDCQKSDSRVSEPDEHDVYDGNIRAWWD